MSKRLSSRRAPALLLLAGPLAANRKDNQARGGGHQQNTEDAVLPDAIVACDGQVGAAGVDYGQGGNGVDAAIAVGRKGDRILKNNCKKIMNGGFSVTFSLRIDFYWLEGQIGEGESGYRIITVPKRVDSGCVGAVSNRSERKCCVCCRA